MSCYSNSMRDARNAAKQTDGGGSLISQREAAAAAGLSERRQVTAVRVANVNGDVFHAQVESDDPPTMTELAAQGMSAQPRPPGFQKATHLIGTLKRFAEFCRDSDPAIVAQGLHGFEADGVRADIATVDNWLDKLIVSLPEEKEEELEIVSYQDKLTREINKTLDDWEEEKRNLVASWITAEICNKHCPGLAVDLTEDREFWHFGGYANTRDEVRRCINERTGDKPKKDKQRWLPGFEHLQSYYMVTRDGDDIGVPTPDLSDDELRAKAIFYRNMGDGCYAHADEIERYVVTRAKKKRAR